MKIVLLLILLAGSEATGAEGAFGVWQVNRDRSTGPHSDIRAVRFDQHPKGEVFTLDTMDSSGHSATSSTILYLDSRARDFQDSGCTGIQSSRRLDSLTIEIVRECRSGDRTTIVRRLAQNGKQMILEVSEQRSGHQPVERRLMFEKR
jgi:hypothetical protein